MSNALNKDEILSDYKNKKVQLDLFCSKVELIIKELLQANGINAHLITSRVKLESSLSKKIDNKDGKYARLADITDIVGLRVILYLENEVDDVAKIIRDEFVVDEANSVDKRNLKVDSFGYKSLHYVVGLNSKRSELTENKSYKAFKAEIQIRSVLQHAWAEIEHDLGYKGESEIPAQHKRAFHRVAALLETADLEFIRLKKELTKYESEVQKKIKKAPENVRIDKASLKYYLKSSTVVAGIDKNIVSGWPSKILDSQVLADLLLPKLSFFDIYTIKDLNDLLIAKENDIVSFARFFLSSTRDLPNGISIFYLLYVLLMENPDINVIEEYLNYGERLASEDFANELMHEFENFKAGKNRGEA